MTQQLQEGRYGPTKHNDIGTFEHRGNNIYVIQEKTALKFITYKVVISYVFWYCYILQRRRILCEILRFKINQIQLHKCFANVVKWILHMFDKYVGSLSGEHFMSIFGHIFLFECRLNTLPFNFYHHIFHLSHFFTCP